MTLSADLAAQGPLPTEPILRLNTNAHTAPINRIATDAHNRLVVTASDDKTARVWSLPDRRLLRVLRVPIDQGGIGYLFAVAITPDGATVALSGWTGSSGSTESIYLVEQTSGKIRQRISGLPKSVRHLSYSKDGRYLVAAMDGGIQVYDVRRGYTALPSDGAYGDTCEWADFDSNGRLVTASHDGFIRLYATGRYDAPIAKVSRHGGGQPLSAAFSPDGQRVAVAHGSHAAVVVLSGKDLTFLYTPDIRGVAGDWYTVAWSSTGRRLYAARKFGESATGVRIWEDGGLGRYVDVSDMSEGTVRHLVPLKDGSVLYATAEPSIGLIDITGRAKSIWRHEMLELGASKSLDISPDGTTVELLFWPSEKRWQRIQFDIRLRRISLNPTATFGYPPLTHAPGWSITGWRNDVRPTVNGRPVILDRYDTSRSLAIIRKGYVQPYSDFGRLQGASVSASDRFILGTDRGVYLFDSEAERVWSRRDSMLGRAWHVNVTHDGRQAITAHADGTIRWRRISDGHEVLALFIHGDGQRWVAWTPEGHYDISPGADPLIGWHVNRGEDQAPDFLPVGSFNRRIDGPLLIAAVTPIDSTAQSAPRAAPPVVEIQEPTGDVVQVSEPKLALKYTVHSPVAPVTRISAAIDGQTVALDELQSSPPVGSERKFTGHLTLPLPPRDVTVSLFAENSFGLSRPATTRVEWAGVTVQMGSSLTPFDGSQPIRYTFIVELVRPPVTPIRAAIDGIPVTVDLIKEHRSSGPDRKFMYELTLSVPRTATSASLYVENVVGGNVLVTYAGSGGKLAEQGAIERNVTWPPASARQPATGTAGANTRVPIIELLDPVTKVIETSRSQLSLTYNVRSPAAPVTQLTAMIDKQPIQLDDRQRLPPKDNDREFTGNVTVVIPPRDVTVSLVAENAHGASAPTLLTVKWVGKGQPPPPAQTAPPLPPVAPPIAKETAEPITVLARAPIVEIIDPAGKEITTVQARLSLRYRVRSPSAPVTRVRAKVDDVPIELDELQRSPPKGSEFEFMASLNLPLPRQDTTVSVLAESAHGVSEAATLDVKRIVAPLSLVPVITILDPAGTEISASKPELSLTYTVSSPSAPVIRIKAMIDGAIVDLEKREQSSPKANDREFTDDLKLVLPSKDLKVSLVAENVHGASAPAELRVKWTGVPDFLKPTLYLLAVGVSKYKDGTLDLDFAARDATEFVRIMEAQKGGLYKKDVIVIPLIDHQATKAAIEDKLDLLAKEASQRDVVILFFSGHGIKQRGTSYAFLPYDADRHQQRRTYLHDFELKYHLSNIPGKKLVFLDSCYSGNLYADQGYKEKEGLVQPEVDELAKELAKAADGLAVFASSSPTQPSRESQEWRHSAFTKVLLEGIQGGAKYSNDRQITLVQLEVYVIDRLKKLVGGEQAPRIVRINLDGSLPVSIAR